MANIPANDKNKIKIVLFDMDGTILDTLEDLTDATNYVLTINSYPTHTTREVRTFVGNGVALLIERAAPKGLSAEKLKALVTQFKDYYKVNCAKKTRPYPGIPSLLKTLKSKNILTAVVSNKPFEAVGVLCEKYFPTLIDYPVGQKAGVPIKPDPAAVNTLLNGLKIPREAAIFVGDSTVDIATGWNAKLKTIGVSWGFQDKDLLKSYPNPPLIVDDTGSLLDAILS